MNFIDWITQNWQGVLNGVLYFLLGSVVIVGFFNGPAAGKAKTILERIIALIRTLGIGTYKDEPGSVSMPGKPDTKERVFSKKKVGD